MQPPLLDRLLEGENGPEGPFTLAQLLASVQRDLEQLLNTRHTFHHLSPAFAETRQSVLTYGLPDFSTLDPGKSADRQQLLQAVEFAIRAFEPRLTAVSVAFVSKPGEGVAQMRVEGRLVAGPASTRVSFDVVMPLDTRRYEVRESL